MHPHGCRSNSFLLRHDGNSVNFLKLFLYIMHRYIQSMKKGSIFVVLFYFIFFHLDSLLFFYFLKFYLSIIDLYFCDNFWCTTNDSVIHESVIHMHYFSDSHPKQIITEYWIEFLLLDSQIHVDQNFTHCSVCMPIPSLQFIPPPHPFPFDNHKFVSKFCESVPTLQMYSFV